MAGAQGERTAADRDSSTAQVVLLRTLRALELRLGRPVAVSELAEDAGLPAGLEGHLAERLQAELSAGHLTCASGTYGLTVAGRNVLERVPPSTVA